jgi:hypothetical protein
MVPLFEQIRLIHNNDHDGGASDQACELKENSRCLLAAALQVLVPRNCWFVRSKQNISSK